MFNWLINVFTGREKDWLSRPREVPTFAKGIKPGDNSWFMSQEFAHPKYPNKRVYLAAHQEGGEKSWNLYLYSRDTKSEKKSKDGKIQKVRNDRTFRGSTSVPEDIIETMMDFERECKSLEFTPLEHSSCRATYPRFANQHGIHFNTAGRAFEVEADEAISEPTIMSRRTLDKLFNTEAEAAVPKGIKTWDDIYTRIVYDMPKSENISLEDLTRSKGWASFAPQAAKALEELSGLGRSLNDPAIRLMAKQNAIQSLVDSRLVADTCFRAGYKRKLARHLMDSAVMVGLVRAGHELYEEQFKPGADLAPDMIELLEQVSDAVKTFAKDRFDLDSADVAPISDIMTQPLALQKLPLKELLESAPVVNPKPASKSRRDSFGRFASNDHYIDKILPNDSYLTSKKSLKDDFNFRNYNNKGYGMTDYMPPGPGPGY